MMRQHAAKRNEAAKLLARIEAELHGVDHADDQLGAHAEDAGGKLDAELRRRGAAMPTDPREQAEYLYLLRHRHKARQVAELSAAARRRRGAG